MDLESPSIGNIWPEMGREEHGQRGDVGRVDELFDSLVRHRELRLLFDAAPAVTSTRWVMATTLFAQLWSSLKPTCVPMPST